LSRELLALSSLLSVARTGGFLSEMNAEVIIREAHLLLQEAASYEEPRVLLEDAPTLAELAKRAPAMNEVSSVRSHPRTEASRSIIQTANTSAASAESSKRHLSDTQSSSVQKTERQAAILLILSTKGPSYIKDISTLIRGVSEKTIQRELQTLINAGHVRREGERRWTQYFLA
jgi:hypothetical protein